MSGRRRLLLVIGALLAAVAAWILWAPWPDPVSVPLRWRPDAIVILGGGNEDRVRQGKLLADLYPESSVIVTGDGGLIVLGLLASGVPAARIVHEQNAGSTMENAALTAPVLIKMHTKRVVVVTNWFHIPRSLAVFRHQHPELEFAGAFEPKSKALTRWDRDAQRRERAAALVYLVRYGVWSW